MPKLKRTLNLVLHLLGLHIQTERSYKLSKLANEEIGDLLNMLLAQHGVELPYRSQLGQDVICQIVNGFKKNGFFVEFGATDGVELSNTWLLEKYFAWDGILAEPMLDWYPKLTANRKCKIDQRCVWKQTGEKIEFLQAQYGELSTIKSFKDSDMHEKERENSSSYFVETVSLEDLLVQHNAPQQIDFLSIDTEGSEYDIISNFDFSSFRFNLICIEHNYTANREKINSLLSANGYNRILTGMSKWDDWFVPIGKFENKV